MNISDKGICFIQSFEGFRDEAYLDTGNVATIGFGTTYYPNGAKVLLGEKCSEAQAIYWLKNDVKKAEKAINQIAWQIPLTQNQYDALVSFQYNCGGLSAKQCKLRDKAIINPNDETIYKYNAENIVDSCEFLRWVRDHGVIVKGLINRRKAEADFYAGANSSK